MEIKKTIDLVAKGLMEKSFSERSMGLTEGLAGIAIFFHYAADVLNNDTYKEYGNQLLEEAVAMVESSHQKYNHADGIAGFAWSINHLANKGFLDLEVDGFLSGIDEFMLTCVNHDLEDDRKNLDFFWGATGVVNYLLTRPQTDENVKGLGNYLTFLETNFVDPENGKPWEDEIINLTFAHGIPSYLSVIMGYIENEIFVDRALAILESGIEFILTTEREGENRSSMFSGVIFPNHPKKNSRMGWCQGDLMMGQLFWRAGTYLDRKDFQDKAIEVLTHTTHRKEPAQTQIVDAGICHGTGGLAHIYNRIAYYTQHQIFKDAAMHWMQETLDMAFEDGDTLFYKAFKGGEITSYEKDESFNMGSAGVGLALIAFLTEDAPDWDNALLLS